MFVSDIFLWRRYHTPLMVGSVFAIADLHLAFGTPEKSMERFGWKNYTERISQGWLQKIKESDLVLLAGDISWAMKPEGAAIDLEWIGRLPGTKLLIRGNHDFWWQSPSQVRKILPPSCHLIQNSAYSWHGLTIGGARLWDSDEFSYNSYIDFVGEGAQERREEEVLEDRRIFERELMRLEMSLQAMDPKSNRRLAMTHYPPIGPTGEPTRASSLFEKYRVEKVVFGHLHNLRKGSITWGEKRGVSYFLTAADYLDFVPLQII